MSRFLFEILARMCPWLPMLILNPKSVALAGFPHVCLAAHHRINVCTYQWDRVASEEMFTVSLINVCSEYNLFLSWVMRVEGGHIIDNVSYFLGLSRATHLFDTFPAIAELVANCTWGPLFIEAESYSGFDADAEVVTHKSFVDQSGIARGCLLKSRLGIQRLIWVVHFSAQLLELSFLHLLLPSRFHLIKLFWYRALQAETSIPHLYITVNVVLIRRIEVCLDFPYVKVFFAWIKNVLSEYLKLTVPCGSRLLAPTKDLGEVVTCPKGQDSEGNGAILKMNSLIYHVLS